MWIEVPDACYLGKEFQNTTFINLNDLCKIRVEYADARVRDKLDESLRKLGKI